MAASLWPGFICFKREILVSLAFIVGHCCIQDRVGPWCALASSSKVILYHNNWSFTLLYRCWLWQPVHWKPGSKSPDDLGNGHFHDAQGQELSSRLIYHLPWRPTFFLLRANPVGFTICRFFLFCIFAFFQGMWNIRWRWALVRLIMIHFCLVSALSTALAFPCSSLYLYSESLWFLPPFVLCCNCGISALTSLLTEASLQGY